MTQLILDLWLLTYNPNNRRADAKSLFHSKRTKQPLVILNEVKNLVPQDSAGSEILHFVQ